MTQFEKLTLLTIMAIIFYSTWILITIYSLDKKISGQIIPGKTAYPEMHEYQIELDFDTVYIYQDGRFVDSYIVGDTLTPFETILADDNR